jgi:general secretion pathway protein M
MTEGPSRWWAERSLREQRLLLVMLTLLALVAVWLLAIRPLSDALASEQRRHGEAEIALAHARGRAAATRRLSGERTAAAPLPIDRLISRTSAEAGFTNARIAGQGPTRATFALDAARAPAFFAWVRMLERRGLVVESLRARANSDRTLAVEAAFRARGAP